MWKYFVWKSWKMWPQVFVITFWQRILAWGYPWRASWERRVLGCTFPEAKLCTISLLPGYTLGPGHCPNLWISGQGMYTEMEHAPLHSNPFQYRCYFIWTWHLSVLQYQRLSLGISPWYKFPNLNTTIRLMPKKSLEQSWCPNPCLLGVDPHNPGTFWPTEQSCGVMHWDDQNRVVCMMQSLPVWCHSHMTLAHIIEKKLNSCVQLPLFVLSRAKSILC